MTYDTQRYRELLTRYFDPPRGATDQADLDSQLVLAEDAILTRTAFRPGLLTYEQVRANATPEGLAELSRLEIPRSPALRNSEFRLIPEGDWLDAIQQKQQDAAENSGLVQFTLDQDGIGSCGSEGMGGSMMATQNKMGVSPVVLLNPLGLYGLVNGNQDRGSSLSDNVAAAAKYGIPSEAVWPRSNGWRRRLSDEAKQDALRNRIDEFWRVGTREEFATALLLGMFVYFGYPGHAIFATDLIDLKRFRYKNSWGSAFGVDGFGTLTWDRIEWSYGAWAIRTCIRPT